MKFKILYNKKELASVQDSDNITLDYVYRTNSHGKKLLMEVYGDLQYLIDTEDEFGVITNFDEIRVNDSTLMHDIITKKIATTIVTDISKTGILHNTIYPYPILNITIDLVYPPKDIKKPSRQSINL